MQFLPSRPGPQLQPYVQAPTDSALNQISLEYPYGELQKATGNFEASSNIGSGSYGGVYKGELKDGTEVAIKVLDVPDEAGFEEEVKVLSKFRHPNLVILMGFARHGTQRSLVYELLAGGDVHKRLHRSCVEGFPFPWNERVSIALDAACGLSHLHSSSPKVFHRDIKTPNILLDKNGTAKMADFGLACLSHASAHRVKQASGTVGYACPLYVQRGVVTMGSEVYSFGMVLLELLTASPPAYVGNGNGAAADQIQYLANHIKGDINIVLSLMDTKAQWTPPVARAIGDFALNCINMQEDERPNFTEIVRTVRSIHDGSALEKLAAATSGVTPPHRQGTAVAKSQASGQSRTKSPAHSATPLMHCPGRPPAVSQVSHEPAPQRHCPGRPTAVSQASHEPTPQRHCPGRPISKAASQAPPHEAATPLMHCPGRPTVVGHHRPTVEGPQGFSPAHRTPPPGAVPGPQPTAAHGCLDITGALPARHISPPPKLPHQSLQAPQSMQRYAPPGVAPPALAAAPTVAARHTGGGYAAGGCPQPMPVAEMESTAKKQQMATQAPVLFTLECVFSEGISLQDVPAEQRLIVHRLASEDDAVCGAPLPPLRVGRIFQTALFDLLVTDDGARSTISREHFQVWAEEAPSPPLSSDAGESRIPCSFCLTNFSGNGTHINDDHLQARGERYNLCNGDVITLSRSITGPDGSHQARFIQFRFDLSESCLREAEWFHAGSSPPRSESSEEQDQALSEDNMENTPCGDRFEGELAFELEVCGPGVHEVPLERRRLAYSPPLEEEGQTLYSALLVGRAHQLDFWQEVLHNEAFNTLSRQHFEVQTWRSASNQGSHSKASFSFLVRNLSEVNPIYVRGGLEGTEEQLAKGEQRHLLDGDEIVLNLNQDHTFWLIFRDLTKSTSITASSYQDQPGCPHRLSQDGPPAFDAPFEVSLANADRAHLEADLRSAATRRSHGAAVLRPPVSLMMKDEDEISTTATPLDLLHDEQEEDEDDDDDATHVGMMCSTKAGAASLGAGYSTLRARAGSHGGAGGTLLGARERDGRCNSGLDDTCAIWKNSGMPAAGALLGAVAPSFVRDARGVREEHRPTTGHRSSSPSSHLNSLDPRSHSPTAPAGYTRGFPNGPCIGTGAPWDARLGEVPSAQSLRRSGFLSQNCAR